MKIRSLSTLALAGLLVTAATAFGAEPAETRSFSLRVETPAVETVEQEDGFTELRLEGFGTYQALVGEPDIPTRTILVAIPAGAVPRLEARPVGATSFRALLPRPMPRLELRSRDAAPLPSAMALDATSAATEGEVRRLYEPSPEGYDGEGTLPSRIAWLGRTGVLRDQRYVEVHLAPLRFDRERGGLLIDSAIDLTVHFEGARVGRQVAVGSDRFEPIYRRAFVNYSQGRAFRLGAGNRVGPRNKTAPLSAALADGPIRRIRVSADGPLRIDHALVLAEAPAFLATDPRDWILLSRGEQVPLQLHQVTGDDSLFESGEWVQFYGQALDDEPATVLNYDKPANPIENLYEVRDFSDENAYFLGVGGGPQPTMSEADATPAGGVPASHFTSTARVEEETLDFYFPIPDELYFWMPPVSENSGPRSESVPLPGLVSGQLAAEVRLSVRGFTDCASLDPDHQTRVSLENDLSETLLLPGGNPDNVGNENVGDHDGNKLYLHEFAWSHEPGDPELTDPLDVLLDATTFPGACPTGGGLLNENILNWIEIDYAREFRAVSDRLDFVYPDGEALIEVHGFSGSAIEVYEITGTIGDGPVVDAVRLTGIVAEFEIVDSTWLARFRMAEDGDLADGTPRRFVAVAAPAVAVADASDFEADRVSTLMSDTAQADLVVIAHPDLLDSECSVGNNPCSYDADCTVSAADRCELVTGSEVDLLLTHRAAQGYSARLARIQDVEDEFGDGLAGPLAIRNFLAWLIDGGWGGEPPAYGLLLGDGSYEYKGGAASGNYVPTQVMVKEVNNSTAGILPHYPSDNVMAQVAGDDQLADLTIGRLTARTFDEADELLRKIRLFETDSTPAPWRSRMLFISDRGKNYSPTEAGGFEAMNALGASFLAGTNYTWTELRYWSGICDGIPAQCDADLMNQLILDHVNGFDIAGEGVAMVQFSGHGNFDLWSDDVIFCANEENANCPFDDTELLTNADALPWLLVHNCLTGGFHAPRPKSFGEQWLKRPLGGAFGVFAPSGLGFQFIGYDVTEVVWGEVFGPRKERVIGIPVMDTLVELCANQSIEPCQYYTLLGDPLSRLGLPHVEPATLVEATSSTGTTPFVDLSWTASGTPGATYDVYRKEITAGTTSWGKINLPPIGGASFHDDTVIAAKTYRYYVVASAGGFESAWSNFNTECEPTPGPDCVQAKPLNLVPPAVTRPAVTVGRRRDRWCPCR